MAEVARSFIESAWHTANLLRPRVYLGLDVGDFANTIIFVPLVLLYHPTDLATVAEVNGQLLLRLHTTKAHVGFLFHSLQLSLSAHFLLSSYLVLLSLHKNFLVVHLFGVKQRMEDSDLIVHSL
jgi:hypothetical protein